MRNSVRKIIELIAIVSVASPVSICAREVRLGMEREFKPTCVEAVRTPVEVRPGGQIGVTLRFRNDGTAPARFAYAVLAAFAYAACSSTSVSTGSRSANLRASVYAGRPWKAAPAVGQIVASKGRGGPLRPPAYARPRDRRRRTYVSRHPPNV